VSTRRVPPTFDDARLILELFELRREAKLREARAWFGQDFWPNSVQDVLEALAAGSPHNPHLRMISGYWEMAASFIVRGILHEDLFLDSGGEMLFLWAKIGQFVPELREKTASPDLLFNVEKVIQGSARARAKVDQFRARFRRMQEAGGRS
jgi:hypothetical protein